MYLCIFCRERPAVSVCPECMTWDNPGETPGIDQVDDNAPPDPDPAPGRRILLPPVRTTAREWLDEDRRQDAIARAWSQDLLRLTRGG